MDNTQIQEIKDVIKKGQTAKAHLLWQELRSVGDEALKIWITPLKIVALPLLVEGEIVELFKEDLNAVAKAHSILVAEKFRRRLNLVSDEQQDAFLSIIEQSAHKNNLNVVKEALNLPIEREEVPIKSTAPERPQAVPLQQVQFDGAAPSPESGVPGQRTVLATQQSGTPTDHFDDHDAKEIDWHQQAVPTAGPSLDYEKITTALIQKYSLQLADQFVEKRFISIVSAYIKGLRNTIQTKEMLSRSHKIGGAEIPEDTALKIITELETHYPAVQQAAPILNSKPLVTPHAEALPTPPQAQQPQASAKLSTAQARPQAEKLNLEHMSGVAAPKDGRPSAIKKLPVRRTVNTKKPRMQDVAPSQKKAMSTSEQLGTIDLDDVRMSPNGIQDILTRVKHEIEVVAKQSFAKKSEAIKQWHQSPLYKDYVTIGGKSVQEGKHIDQVIAENNDGLSMEEFDAIADFNSLLSA